MRKLDWEFALKKRKLSHWDQHPKWWAKREGFLTTPDVSRRPPLRTLDTIMARLSLTSPGSIKVDGPKKKTPHTHKRVICKVTLFSPSLWGLLSPPIPSLSGIYQVKTF
jgi:hypothetical protein